jgi:predicted membrane protein
MGQMDQQPPTWPRPGTGPIIPITPKLVFGVAVMALGLLFLLENLGVLDADTYLRFWPVVLIFVGVVKGLDCWPRGASCTGAAFFIVVGTGLLFSNLGWLSFDTIFPMILVAIGAFIVYRAVVRPGRKKREAGLSPTSEPPGPTRSANVVNGFAILGGVTRTNRSADFEGGDLSAFMGGCEVDLRDARISSGEAVIDVFAFWGGIEIKVPEDWQVECRGLAVMGAFEDKTRGSEGHGQRLVLTGLAIMGGVEVKN